jgi:hypothetical protein
MLHTVVEQVVVMQIVVRQAVVQQVNQETQFCKEYTLPSGIVNHLAWSHVPIIMIVLANTIKSTSIQ